MVKSEFQFTYHPDTVNPLAITVNGNKTFTSRFEGIGSNPFLIIDSNGQERFRAGFGEGMEVITDPESENLVGVNLFPKIASMYTKKAIQRIAEIERKNQSPLTTARDFLPMIHINIEDPSLSLIREGEELLYIDPDEVVTLKNTHIRDGLRTGENVGSIHEFCRNPNSSSLGFVNFNQVHYDPADLSFYLTTHIDLPADLDCEDFMESIVRSVKLTGVRNLRNLVDLAFIANKPERQHFSYGFKVIP